jgi:hypothetical protein
MNDGYNEHGQIPFLGLPSIDCCNLVQRMQYTIIGVKRGCVRHSLVGHLQLKNQPDLLTATVLL